MPFPWAQQWDTHNQTPAAIGSAKRDAWNEFRQRPDTLAAATNVNRVTICSGRSVPNANSAAGQ